MDEPELRLSWPLAESSTDDWDAAALRRHLRAADRSDRRGLLRVAGLLLIPWATWAMTCWFLWEGERSLAPATLIALVIANLTLALPAAYFYIAAQRSLRTTTGTAAEVGEALRLASGRVAQVARTGLCCGVIALAIATVVAFFDRGPGARTNDLLLAASSYAIPLLLGVGFRLMALRREAQALRTQLAHFALLGRQPEPPR